jgi:cell volume regulation protein A
LILVAGALLAAAIAASVLASRLRFPALILFLGIGMLIGSDGFGWIDFADVGYPLRSPDFMLGLAMRLFH